VTLMGAGVQAERVARRSTKAAYLKEAAGGESK
jgi:hypothetical protein